MTAPKSALRSTTDRSSSPAGRNELELKATSVLKLPIDEASAKIRSGDPKDDEEDYEMDVWAGVLPLTTVAGEPIADARSKPEVKVAEHVKDYRPVS